MKKKTEMQDIVDQLKKDKYFYLDKYEPTELYDTKIDEKIKRKTAGR